MRLFVAVDLDHAARQLAAATAEDLRHALGPAVTARWVPIENLHLTVRFIGHVDDALAPAVLDALARPLEMDAFDLEFGNCGVFPPSGAPRVLWVGLTRGLPALASMHGICNARLQPLGFAPESRPFSAHLTLARLKETSAPGRSALRQVLRSLAPRVISCRIQNATVYRSHMSPKGSRYEGMACIPLSGAG